MLILGGFNQEQRIFFQIFKVSSAPCPLKKKWKQNWTKWTNKLMLKTKKLSLEAESE